jgi:acetate kinase
MRKLLADGENPAARLAVDAFCYRVRKYVGAYLAVLGGLDGIVFGGGIGENSSEVRSASLSGLEALGIVVDEAKNRAAVGREGRISPPGAPVEIRVMQVDEAGEMARDAASVLDSGR